MKLRRAPDRSDPETIVPLIDVVFFLLVFFMLVGRLDATAPFEVTPPTALTGSDMPGGGRTLSVSQTGALALDGSEQDRAAVLADLAAQLAQDKTLFIRINAHAGTEVRHVLPLVSHLEDLGAVNVSLVVTPPDQIP